jgi:hypothetical protein
MSTLLDSIMELPVPFNMVVLIVLIGSVAGVIGTIAKEVRKYLCHQNELELKREMIARGMEPQEIDQVLRANTSGK